MALSIIEGRLSDRYNHFKEYEFYSCQATATRLMGVVAMKITWRGTEDKRSRLYQVIHLDYSEYGIDDYYEFECTPGTDTYADNKEDMNYYWHHFISVMGGDVVRLLPDAMLRLIDSAMPLAAEDFDREYDNEDNEELREYAKLRLGMMKDELAKQGVTMNSCNVRQAIRSVSPKKLTACETINYFIMRLVDRDFDAAEYLSTIDRKTLEECELAAPGIQTLVRNSIKASSRKKDPPADRSSFPYRCTMTTLGRNGYFHSTCVIYLSGDARTRDAVVTQIETGSVLKLSEFESAIQISRSEYITVYRCPDEIMNGFDGSKIPMISSAEPALVPNGWLYTIYNQDNSHVDRQEYRLGDDVYGYALLTISGEFVLMSNDMSRIGMLDSATSISQYGQQMELNGRYLIDTPVFHTLCQASGADFEDLIVPKSD